MPSDLIFPQSYEPRGFSTLATAQHSGYPDPIVRELLQNSLDAAKYAGRGNAGNPAQVTFTITEYPRSAIPGLVSYARAFDAAVEDRTRREQGNISPNEQQVIRRIRDVLARETVPCLFCRDNGNGLSDVARVLFEGNTNKPSGGGSFGVGHMTAFAASDLRYVLYAGRTSQGDVAGGHAILAAHPNRGQLCSADGYYTRERDLFSMDSSRFNADVPSLLLDQFGQMSDTGTVVCVTGFNNFREDEDAVAAICRVAAINFVAAIQRGEFVINVKDEIRNTERVIDRSNLGEILNSSSAQQRTKSGWLAGGRAFAAWETLCNGQRLDLGDSDSTEVWFRRIDSGRNFQRQVNIFRDGMWITYSAPYLAASSFGGVQPFDAIVLLKQGELYNLIRDAETPEHREIEPQRLDNADRQALYDTLRTIASRLREEVGESPTEDEYVPTGFAVFDAHEMRDADIRPRYRPRPGGGHQNITERGGGGNDAEDHHGNRRMRRRQGTRPAPGTTAAVRTSYRPRSNESGAVEALTVAWKPAAPGSRSDLALRIRIASGSDETCDQPLSADYQQLAGIEIDGRLYRPGNDSQEIVLPTIEGVGTVRLARPLQTSSGVEVDVVYRRRTATSEDSE